MPEIASAILVASTSADEPVYREVVERLAARGSRAIVIDADAIASGSEPFELSFGPGCDLSVRYGDVVFDPRQIAAAWYRHPDLFGYNHSDRAKQMCLTHEAAALLEGLWATIPNEKWLNPPTRIRTAQIKLLQLRRAAEAGFSTPVTLIANRWPSVLERFGDKDFVAKMSEGLLYEDGAPKTVYTTVLDPAGLGDLATTNPFPAILQSYIAKRREWRVTVVGDAIFAAVIHTSESAKDDWRRHQLGDEVSFEAAELPKEEEQRCRAVLDHYGLRFGAFDLIEGDAGQFVFLELNPNGQYLWLERSLGMPISEAIAAELFRIASQSSITMEQTEAAASTLPAI